jgi:hypothetical protein
LRPRASSPTGWTGLAGWIRGTRKKYDRQAFDVFFGAVGDLRAAGLRGHELALVLREIGGRETPVARRWGWGRGSGDIM